HPSPAAPRGQEFTAPVNRRARPGGELWGGGVRGGRASGAGAGGGGGPRRAGTATGRGVRPQPAALLNGHGDFRVGHRRPSQQFLKDEARKNRGAPGGELTVKPRHVLPPAFLMAGRYLLLRAGGRGGGRRPPGGAPGG